MNVKSLKAVSFRNIEDAQMVPCDGMNLLYGDNAHGKTNLLEAIWLMTGGKSFRGTKDADLVMFGKPQATVETVFCGRGREQKASVTIEGRRKAMLNGVPLPAANRLTGQFCAVIFSPDHLSLIKDGPEGRRKFMDAACCQLRPSYMKVLAEYTRLLTQRNKLVKAIKTGEQPCDDVLLDTFDEHLAIKGAAVREYRTDYIGRMRPIAETMYAQLAKGKEHLRVGYQESTDANELFEQFRKARITDLRVGSTTVGPHRDDVGVEIGGNSARLFGSQGQQRSGVLALKLAEASLLCTRYEETPVILLDDVMSELDSSRQDYILNQIEGFQVFITCCEPSAIKKLVGGRVFRVENGSVSETFE